MRDLLVCTVFALLAVIQCETIHFTNSPSHLIGSKNITSYKLLVKNSDPITIIEANKAIHGRPHFAFAPNYYANDRVDINVDDSADSRLHDYHVKLIANMDGSHQVQTANTQNVRGTVGFTVTGSPSNSQFGNDYKTSGLEVDHDAESSNLSAKKVVYSPILLKKFMKEYSEKLKNADLSTKNEIQKIHEKIHQQQTDDSTHDNREVLEFDKSIENMEQKYNLNGYHDQFEDENRRKRPSEPYKDRDGWVTLQAVPWSSSTVSKWHPHGDRDEDTHRKPSPNFGRPYNKPEKPFPYHDDMENDYYSRPKPAYVDRDSRPGVYSSWTKPHSMENNGRPRPQPYRFGESSAFGLYKFPDRERDRYSSSRPWSSGGTGGGGSDIITDTRPSEFPSESHSSSHHYHDNDHYSASSSNIHSSYQDRPSEGNGEWVLISSTKGYQTAGGNRRQQGNRVLSQRDTKSSVIVNVPQSMRMHKALKLTVLPALEPAKNSTFSTDLKRKPTTVIHGGMLEIDATHETIEDDVRATLQAQKKLTTANPVKTPPSTENKHQKLLKGNFRLREQNA